MIKKNGNFYYLLPVFVLFMFYYWIFILDILYFLLNCRLKMKEPKSGNITFQYEYFVFLSFLCVFRSFWLFNSCSYLFSILNRQNSISTFIFLFTFFSNFGKIPLFFIFLIYYGVVTFFVTGNRSYFKNRYHQCNVIQALFFFLCLSTVSDVFLSVKLNPS